MTLPATKAQKIAEAYLPRLAAHESMDDLTARRAIREAEAALGPSSLPERAAMFQVIGIASARLGKLTKAAAAFRNALHCDPHAAEHRTNLAACLADMGQFAEALTVLHEADPRDRHAAFVVDLNRADAYRGLGDRPAALASLRLAVQRLDPANAEEAFMLASQYAAMTLEDDAVEWLGRASALSRGADAGDTPALDLFDAAPESLRRRVEELPVLLKAVAALRASRAEEGTAPPAVQLSAQQLDRLARLVEQPPEPTEALRALVRDSRA